MLFFGPGVRGASEIESKSIVLDPGSVAVLAEHGVGSVVAGQTVQLIVQVDKDNKALRIACVADGQAVGEMSPSDASALISGMGTQLVTEELSYVVFSVNEGPERPRRLPQTPKAEMLAESQSIELQLVALKALEMCLTPVKDPPAPPPDQRASSPPVYGSGWG